MREIEQPVDLRIQTVEEHPQLIWETVDPYNSHPGQREVSTYGVLTERSIEDVHQIWMRKCPRVFRSLYFDADVNKLQSVQDQLYSTLIKSSLQEYQQYPKSTGKKVVGEGRGRANDKREIASEIGLLF